MSILLPLKSVQYSPSLKSKPRCAAATSTQAGLGMSNSSTKASRRARTLRRIVPRLLPMAVERNSDLATLSRLELLAVELDSVGMRKDQVVSHTRRASIGEREQIESTKRTSSSPCYPCGRARRHLERIPAPRRTMARCG